MATDEQQQGAMEALGDDLKSLPRNFLRGILRPPAVRQRAANLEATQTANQAAQQQIAARNALAEMMGDAGAADPSGYAQVQQPGLTRTTQAIQAQQAGTAATREERLAAAQQAELEAAEAERNRARLLNAGRMLNDRVSQAAEAGASPEQIGQIFDATMPLVRKVDETIDPEMEAWLREQVMQDPSSLQTIIDGLQKPQNMGGGQQLVETPDGRVVQVIPGQDPRQLVDPVTGESLVSGSQTARSQRTETQARRAEVAALAEQRQQRRQQLDILAEQREVRAQAQETEEQRGERMQAVENTRSISDRLLRDIDSAIGIMEESPFFQEYGTAIVDVPLGLGTAAAARIMPRSTAAQVRGEIESIRGNVAIDNVLRLKRESATLGQIPQRQLEMLADLAGKITEENLPSITIRNLRDLHDATAAISEAAVEAGIDLTQSYDGLVADLENQQRQIDSIAESAGLGSNSGDTRRTQSPSAPTMRRNPETGVWEMTNGN